MSVKIIQERLESYRCQTQQEEEFALREITQDVALAALSRAGFFKGAAFQGGTCLRILYSLNRFSEDIDFVLQRQDRHFRLEPYLKNLALEFEAYGYRLVVQDRSKVTDAVKKAFLKDDSIGKVLTFRHMEWTPASRAIRLKLEVDSYPPQGSEFETKFLDFPFPFSVTVQGLPSLFAGKSHALLCREYVKGRDWYDFVWYATRRTPINFPLLAAACEQLGPWRGQKLTLDMTWYQEQMEKKIRSIHWKSVREDAARFLKQREQATLQIWDEEFFLDRLRRLSGE